MSTGDAMINMAVIGCGEWGPNHIRNFQSQAGAKVRVAVDLDPKRLQRIRELFPAVECSSEVDQVLSNPGIQAVVVATPLQTHYSLVKQLKTMSPSRGYQESDETDSLSSQVVIKSP